MNDPAIIYRETRSLSAIQRLQLVEMLLSDLDRPDEQIDHLWATEAQNRWDAFHRGELNTLSHEEVMAKYRKP